MTRPLLAFLATTLVASAQDAKLKAKLDQLPKPWVKKLHRLTAAEYESTIRHWQKKHPKLLTVEVPGKTREGEPLYCLKITDPKVTDEDKQIALITALHAGPERSGTTTAMHGIEWLLSDDAEAKETRRRQIVLFMPIINPYAYFKTDRFGTSVGIDPYTGSGPKNWDLKTMTFKAAKEVPELQTFLDVVDRYQPEVHLDLHGIGLQEYAPDQLGDRRRYAGQTMFEVTGSAYSNYALRPWDWRVTEAIIAAGVAEGYPSDRFEADAQRAYWGPAMQSLTRFTWRGRPNFYTSQYAYAKYHTMVAALEIGWEASGLARTKGLLRIGNNVWPTRNRPGYPVERVRSFIGHYVTAWGQTAQQRRTSRKELWKLQSRFQQSVLYPQTDGRILYIVNIGTNSNHLINVDPQKTAEQLQAAPGVNAAALETFIAAGPEIKLATDLAFDRKAPSAPIENGIGFHLRIPYPKPTLVDVRLNGHELKPDRQHGYETWFGNGFTHLRINVPPAISRQQELYIITCAYRPDAQRNYGWTPPAEVLQSLNR
ncbi:MAG: M14 family zinc carboxypeptidase [Limisphaerales bacterium]